jgi:hypothetical protein
MPPDHMRGILNLPKFNYDPTNYDPAAYAAFKQTQATAQTAYQKEQAARSKQIAKDNNKWLKEFLGKEVKKAAAKGKKAMSRDEVTKAAKAGKRLYADEASECFDELSFKQGEGVHAEFAKRNPAGGYDYPDVDLETFLAWCSDSLGEFFNAEIRE